MAAIDGTWETTTKTPMGDQTATMTITSSGDSFTGTSAGAMGSTELKDGRIDGKKATWKMDITIPFPMTLESEATVEGDTLTGGIKAGAFGTMPFTGVRK